MNKIRKKRKSNQNSSKILRKFAKENFDKISAKFAIDRFKKKTNVNDDKMTNDPCQQILTKSENPVPVVVNSIQYSCVSTF